LSRAGAIVLRFGGAHPFVDNTTQFSRGQTRRQIKPTCRTIRRGGTEDEDKLRPIQETSEVRAFQQRERIEFAPNGSRKLKSAPGDPEPFDRVVADPRETEAMVRTRLLKRSSKTTQPQSKRRFTKTNPTESFIEKPSRVVAVYAPEFVRRGRF
jgi:hypothetical protein